MKQELKKELDLIYNYFWLENGLVTLFIFTMAIKAILLNFIITDNLPVIFIDGAVCNILICFFILYLPLFFVKKPKNILAILLTTALTVILIADLIYYRYFNIFLSISQLAVSKQAFSVVPAIIDKFKIIDLLFFSDVIIGTILLFTNKKEKYIVTRSNSKQMVILLFAILLTSSIYLLVLNNNVYGSDLKTNYFSSHFMSLRFGYFGTHLIETWMFLQEKEVKITSNEKKEVKDFISNNSIKQKDNQFTGIAKNKNIIMIQVESLTSAVIGKTVEGQEITPNINNLIDGSYYYSNHYTQIAAGGTSDTDLAVNTSLYPLQKEPAFVFYGNVNYSSLANDLVNDNYHTYSYHGYDADFWNRKVAFLSLGYENSFFGNTYDKLNISMNMGINDKNFFDQTLIKMKDQLEPYFSYIITLSSHTPYSITKEDSYLKIDEKKYSNDGYGYMQNIRYTDQAIGDFLTKLKNNDQYEDSLILLYGDHGPAIDSLIFDKGRLDKNNPNLFGVPLVVKLPNQKVAEVNDIASSHLDIMPTVLNLVGIKSNSNMFGRDLFGSEEPWFEVMDHYFKKSYIKGDLKLTISNSEEKQCFVRINKTYQGINLSRCDSVVGNLLNIRENTEKLIKNNLFSLK